MDKNTLWIGALVLLILAFWLQEKSYYAGASVLFWIGLSIYVEENSKEQDKGKKEREDFEDS